MAGGLCLTRSRGRSYRLARTRPGPDIPINRDSPTVRDGQAMSLANSENPAIPSPRRRAICFNGKPSGRGDRLAGPGRRGRVTVVTVAP